MDRTLRMEDGSLRGKTSADEKTFDVQAAVAHGARACTCLTHFRLSQGSTHEVGRVGTRKDVVGSVCQGCWFE